VIETDAHNCRDTSDTVAITVLPSPTAAITASSLSFCANDSVTLTAPIANSYTYTWFSGTTQIGNGLQNTFVVHNGGDYSVAVFQGSCSDTSATISLMEKPLPAPIISQTGVVLATGSFSTYQWLKDAQPIAGATAQTYTVTEDGSYSVLVSDTSGCSNTATAVVMSNVGVGDVNTPNGISVYPNPVTDVLMIDAPKPVTVQLISLDGKMVLQQNNTRRADMSALPNGSYILRITDNSGQLLFNTNVIKRSH